MQVYEVKSSLYDLIQNPDNEKPLSRTNLMLEVLGFDAEGFACSGEEFIVLVKPEYKEEITAIYYEFLMSDV